MPGWRPVKARGKGVFPFARSSVGGGMELLSKSTSDGREWEREWEWECELELEGARAGRCVAVVVVDVVVAALCLPFVLDGSPSEAPASLDSGASLLHPAPSTSEALPWRPLRRSAWAAPGTSTSTVAMAGLSLSLKCGKKLGRPSSLRPGLDWILLSGQSGRWLWSGRYLFEMGQVQGARCKLQVQAQLTFQKFGMTSAVTEQ